MAAAPRRQWPFWLAAFAALAACVPRRPPPAPLPPPPAAAPAPAPPSAPPPSPSSPPGWEDAALTMGDWSYGAEADGAQAAFAGSEGLLFALRCAPGGRIVLARPGGGALTIVTSFGAHSLSAAAAGGEVALPAADSLFDEIAFSRGRFLVRATGAADLILPTWAEPQRLIEDCRGS